MENKKIIQKTNEIKAGSLTRLVNKHLATVVRTKAPQLTMSEWER